MFHARLETSHYSFDAYGATKEAAVEALRKGWLAHRRMTQAAPWSVFSEDVQVQEIQLGAAYCDGEKLS